MWTTCRHLAVVSLACVALSPALPAAADPPPWGGAWQVHERYHRPDDDGGRVVYLNDGVSVDTDRVPVARGLPYGFNRGTCDRALLDGSSARTMPVAGAVGRAMDADDRECLWVALENLPDNRFIAWAGESGTLFRVSTERTYIKAGASCRDWRASAASPGRSAQTSGTFCRRSDGQWVAAR